MTIQITGTLQSSAWDSGSFPPREQIRDGVWSVPIPIQGNPLRYTLSYLISDKDNLVVIDPGWDSEEGWGLLLDAIRGAGYRLDQVTGCIVTHLHPDHVAMASRLKCETGAWVAMHRIEAEKLYNRINLDRAIALDREWIARCGIPPNRQSEIIIRARHIEYLERVPLPDYVLEDGDTITLTTKTLKVLLTPGHASGHICLVSDADRLIFTADHILPKTNSGIGFNRIRVGDNPLRDYINALQKASAFGSYEVCPGHEYRFSGLAARVSELMERYRNRADEIAKIFSGQDGPTVWSVTESLTWPRETSLGGFRLRLTLSETECYLVYLADREQIVWPPHPSDGMREPS